MLLPSIPLRTAVLLIVCACLGVIIPVLLSRNALRRLVDLSFRSHWTELDSNMNNNSTRVATLTTKRELQAAPEALATCSLERFTDVTGNFRRKGPKRQPTRPCSEPDLLDMVRILSGQTPKLLSKRSHTKREGRETDATEHVVPNLVHYIHFGRGMTFTFLTYLSYLSADKFIRPEYIFLHGDILPTGFWWEKTLEDVRNIYHIYVRDTVGIYGNRFRYPTQHSNLLRLYIMLDYGGIYLDHDVIVVKSFDALRGHDFTMGRALSFTLNNGAMLGRRGAPFAQIWLETYRSPDLSLAYGFESVRKAHNLSTLFPHLVHVEERSLAQPDYRHTELLYRDSYDWSANYAVHVMGETKAKIPTDGESLKGYDCVLGEVMRLVYFGDPKLLSNDTWKGMT